MQLSELTGYDLGERMLSYEPRDAILYALAVGARAEELDLVYERDLRVAAHRRMRSWVYGRWRRPATWAPMTASARCASRRACSCGARCRRLAGIASRGRVAAVWDKGKATIVEVEVSSDLFVLTYSIFLPGVGNWGGSPRPRNGEAPGCAARPRYRLCYLARARRALPPDGRPAPDPH